MEEIKKKIVDEFKYLNDCDDDELYESEDCDEKEDEFQDEFEKHLMDTAFTIRNNLFDYVNTYGLPLCEKLDIDRLIRFIEKVN
jgi:hypothetical protein